MDEDRAFIDFGLQQAEEALKNAAGEADLHLRPQMLRKTPAKRFRSRLRAIEAIVRRLIILLATMLDLSPAKSPSPNSGAGPNASCAQNQHAFKLIPVDWAPQPLPDFKTLTRAPAARAFGQPEIARLLARVSTVLRLIAHPDGAARRLARRIERLRKLKLPRPYCPPPERTHRLSAELGFVASSLPQMITAAFETWYDTG